MHDVTASSRPATRVALLRRRLRGSSLALLLLGCSPSAAPPAEHEPARPAPEAVAAPPAAPPPASPPAEPPPPPTPAEPDPFTTWLESHPQPQWVVAMQALSGAYMLAAAVESSAAPPAGPDAPLLPAAAFVLFRDGALVWQGEGMKSIGVPTLADVPAPLRAGFQASEDWRLAIAPVNLARGHGVRVGLTAAVGGDSFRAEELAILLRIDPSQGPIRLWSGLGDAQLGSEDGCRISTVAKLTLTESGDLEVARTSDAELREGSDTSGRSECKAPKDSVESFKLRPG